VVNDMILGGEAHDVDGTKMYVNVNTINATRWKIATFYDIQSINQAQYQMIINLLIAFMITIILIAIASIIVSERINSPMKQLRKAISALEKGSYDVSLDVKGQKEIVDLAKAFSEMRIRIKDLMHEVIKEQREKEETHFQALQSQINPHFLYNTLDSIVWLSENNRNKDVEKAIIALSKFFRRSVNSENIVTLEEEIDHVFNYLLIQQIRYQNQFNFEIDINDSLKEQRILKLSLQPLVENAIIHGIQPEDDFKTIRVSGYEKDGFIYVEVFNEGYGLTALNIHRILMNIKGDASTTSMGLRNVYQRIKLLYGDLGDLMIESELDEYTKVILKIPRDKDEGG
ncbi:MAG TPA: histidine kinase, partial [Erysipelothrix sp.]|nr:histidine kinase [Erysipelothrix sp.]